MSTIVQWRARAEQSIDRDGTRKTFSTRGTNTRGFLWSWIDAVEHTRAFVYFVFSTQPSAKSERDGGTRGQEILTRRHSANDGRPFIETLNTTLFKTPRHLCHRYVALHFLENTPAKTFPPPNFYNIISAEKIRAGVSQNFAAKNFGTNEDCHREGVSVSGEFSGMENSKPKSLRAVSFDAGASRFVYPSTDQQGNLRLLRKRSRIRVQLFRCSVRGFYLRFLKSTKRYESLSRTGSGNLLIESPASIRSRSLLW